MINLFLYLSPQDLFNNYVISYDCHDLQLEIILLIPINHKKQKLVFQDY